MCKLAGLKAFKDATKHSAGTIVPKLFVTQFQMVAKDKTLEPKQCDSLDLVHYFNLYKAMKREKKVTPPFFCVFFSVQLFFQSEICTVGLERWSYFYLCV